MCREARLTAAEFDLALLVVHRVLVEDHVARQRQRQPLAVQDRAVGGQPDEPVGHGDGVKQAVLEVADEDVRRPHAVELAVVQRHAAATAVVEAGERQTLVAPDLTQVQRRRVFLSYAHESPRQSTESPLVVCMACCSAYYAMSRGGSNRKFLGLGPGRCRLSSAKNTTAQQLKDNLHCRT